MAYIGNIPAEKFTSVDIQNFTVSATANYTLDRPVANENEIELFINNVRQHPGSGKAYTASGTALTLSEATAGTDTMYCVYQGKARQTVTPATSSVTNDMLAGSIADAKISAMAASKLTGTVAQANIADEAINEAKMQISNAPTNGYMLTAQSGNTGGLTWAEAPSGTLVQTGTSFSESAGGTSISIQSCFSTTYENYLIVLNMLPSSNAVNFQMRTLNGSTNYETSYEYASRYFDNDGSQSSNTSTSAGAFLLADSVSSREYDGGVNYHIWCYLDRDDTNSGAFQFHGQGRFTHSNSSGRVHATYVAGHIADIENNKNTDGIKFYFGSGNVESHNIKVYGYNGSAS